MVIETGLMRQLAAMLCAAAMLAGLPVRGQQNELRIVVVQGQEAINLLPQGTGVSPVIEVRDAAGDPVGGAFVQISVRGRNARINGSFAPIEMLADADGRASVTVTPVARGTVRIDVTATFLGATATATISQRNAVTEAEATALAARRRAPRADTDGDELLPGARPQDRGGDSSLLSIGIGAAAAGGGAVALYKLRGDGPLNPRANISGLNGIDGPVIRGVTELTFAAADSQASGEFRWDFGDGETQVGQNVRHVYRLTGTYGVTLTYKEERYNVASVQVGTLSGRWSSHPDLGVTHLLEIEQQDATLTGTWTVQLDPGVPGNNTSTPVFIRTDLAGTLRSPRLVQQLRQLGECERTVTGGTVTNTLNNLNLSGSATQPGCGYEEGWTFTRQP
jgi:hypothetical protein